VNCLRSLKYSALSLALSQTVVQVMKQIGIDISGRRRNSIKYRHDAVIRKATATIVESKKGVDHVANMNNSWLISVAFARSLGYIFVALFLLFAVDVISQIPPNLFSGYAGEWQGIFYVYAPDGTPVKTLKARHVYKIINKYTLEGTQTVTYPDGTVENIHARDYVENGKIYCRVESDRTGVKILEGRLDGSQIFWSRKDSETLETFRERIINGKVYAIDGYGIYGKDRSKVYTFFAEYKRIR
jgi:hypothetical protein